MMQPTDCLCHQYLLVMITQTFDLKEVQFLFCPNVASITTPVPPAAVSVENSVHFNSLYFTSVHSFYSIHCIGCKITTTVTSRYYTAKQMSWNDKKKKARQQWDGKTPIYQEESSSRARLRGEHLSADRLGVRGGRQDKGHTVEES